MKLKESERVWMSQDQEYLMVLPEGHRPPEGLEFRLGNQVNLLQRLVAEAGEGEVEEANRSLVNNLNEAQLLWLPPGMLKEKGGAASLLRNPQEPGSRLSEWKKELKTVEFDLMPNQEEAKSLDLESFLSLLL